MSARPALRTYHSSVSRSVSPTMKTNEQSGSLSPRPSARPAKEHTDRKSTGYVYAEQLNLEGATGESNTSTTNTNEEFSTAHTISSTINSTVEYSEDENEFLEEERTILETRRPTWTIQKLVYYAFIPLLVALVYKTVWHKQKIKSCTFEQLRERKPLQSPDVWDALKINTELMLNDKSKSPNVFLFLHSNQSNEQYVHQLIQDIARETTKCFEKQQVVKMTLKDFESHGNDDYGYPIEQYKKKIGKGNVFLIVNLNDIPIKAVRALHTICDTVQPIARDVTIFLTLRTHYSSKNENSINIAYKTLRDLWEEIPYNELDPLIARVCDQVLLLNS